jgi:hypothetical protein
MHSRYHLLSPDNQSRLFLHLPNNTVMFLYATIFSELHSVGRPGLCKLSIEGLQYSSLVVHQRRGLFQEATRVRIGIQ